MTTLLDIKDIKVPSVNNKFQYNPKIKRMFLNPAYRSFKDILSKACKKVKIEPPVKLMIDLKCFCDIDGPLKPIIDAVQSCFDDDKYIHSLVVNKIPVKRGQLGAVKVRAESI